MVPQLCSNKVRLVPLWLLHIGLSLQCHAVMYNIHRTSCFMKAQEEGVAVPDMVVITTIIVDTVIADINS